MSIRQLIPFRIKTDRIFNGSDFKRENIVSENRVEGHLDQTHTSSCNEVCSMAFLKMQKCLKNYFIEAANTNEINCDIHLAYTLF